jgi:hypothetical protein
MSDHATPDPQAAAPAQPGGPTPIVPGPRPRLLPPEGAATIRCEVCEARPPVAAIAVPDDLALLCGSCMDDAISEGLNTVPALALALAARRDTDGGERP